MNRAIDLISFVFMVRLSLTSFQLGFGLESEALGVVELGIAVFSVNSCLEIFMSHDEVLFIKSNVTTVEIVVRVGVVVINGLLVLDEGAIHFTLMVESQTQVLVVEGKILQRAVLLNLVLLLLEPNRLFVGT